MSERNIRSINQIQVKYFSSHHVVGVTLMRRSCFHFSSHNPGAQSLLLNLSRCQQTKNQPIETGDVAEETPTGEAAFSLEPFPTHDRGLFAGSFSCLFWILRDE